jgi:hypothetical protein
MFASCIVAAPTSFSRTSSRARPAERLGSVEIAAPDATRVAFEVELSGALAIVFLHPLLME